jgi:hypothetical protein
VPSSFPSKFIDAWKKFSLFSIIKFSKIYHLNVNCLFVPSMLMTLLFPTSAFTSHINIMQPFLFNLSNIPLRVENNQQNALNSILIYSYFCDCFYVFQQSNAILSERYIVRRYMGSAIRPMTCLLPYWRWSGSERNIAAPWGWIGLPKHVGAIVKIKIKKYRIQCIFVGYSVNIR